MDRDHAIGRHSTTEAPTSVDRYLRVRRETEALCQPLEVEDHVIQSMPDVSPTKWHLAHTTWFFETFLLASFLPEYRAHDASYAYLFNSYYNTVGEQFDRPRRGLLSRPTVSQVVAYRRTVDEQMVRLLEASPDEVASRIDTFLEVGIHHEQQHQELMLADIKHVLSVNPAQPIYRDRESRPPAGSPALGWIGYPGGVAEIGHGGDEFAFDNERPRHKTYLDPYEIGTRLVTAGEYIEFLEDGGYERPELWLSDGWDTVRERSWSAPLYWEKREGDWYQFTLSGPRRVCSAEPVCHISYYEADAYARWAGARLPTEAEWETAACGAPIEGNFVESGQLHPAPCEIGTFEDGPAQLFGDVWEWTASPYVAYPGYRQPAGALGEYNAKFMSNRYVLRGGSCASPARHMRLTYRNFFAPETRWQFMGARLARDGGDR